MSAHMGVGRRTVSVVSLLPLLLMIDACDQSLNQMGANKSANKSSEELHKKRCESVYIPVMRSKITSASDIERAINSLVDFRRQDIECKRKDVNLVSEAEQLIGLIKGNKSLNVSTQAKLYLMLEQHSDASSSEHISELLGRLCYTHPKDVIDTLAGIGAYLRPGFRNEQFYKMLYVSACGYPRSVSEVEGFDRPKENKSRVEMLKKIKHAGNEHVVKFLLENVYNK